MESKPVGLVQHALEVVEEVGTRRYWSSMSRRLLGKIIILDCIFDGGYTGNGLVELGKGDLSRALKIVVSPRLLLS